MRGRRGVVERQSQNRAAARASRTRNESEKKDMEKPKKPTASAHAAADRLHRLARLSAAVVKSASMSEGKQSSSQTA